MSPRTQEVPLCSQPPAPSLALSGAPGSVTQIPSSPLPIGRRLSEVMLVQPATSSYHSDLCGQSRQVSGAKGQAPLGCQCSTQEVRGPSMLSPREGVPDLASEAFCHLLGYRGQEAALLALGGILMRPGPADCSALLHHCSHPDCPCVLVVLAPGRQP